MIFSARISRMMAFRKSWSLYRPIIFCGVVIGAMALFLSGHNTPSPSRASAQFVPREVIEGAYWSLETGYDSSLMLSNTSGEPIRVYPEMFDHRGQRIEMPVIPLREHERQQLNLRDWL
jgi:hypothetical protein